MNQKSDLTQLEDDLKAFNERDFNLLAHAFLFGSTDKEALNQAFGLFKQCVAVYLPGDNLNEQKGWQWQERLSAAKNKPSGFAIQNNEDAGLRFFQLFGPFFEAAKKISQPADALESVIKEIKYQKMKCSIFVKSAHYKASLNGRQLTAQERTAYEADIAACVYDVSEAVSTLKQKYTQARNALCLKLTETLQRLEKLLPRDEKVFKPVCETTKKLLSLLSNSSYAALEANLKQLLKKMHQTDLYKSWGECKGVSEITSHMMYQLESAVRWLLECLHIVSKSTSEDLVKRGNYFFKGPKKEVFEKFNQALSELKSIDMSPLNAPGMCC